MQLRLFVYICVCACTSPDQVILSACAYQAYLARTVDVGRATL